MSLCLIFVSLINVFLGVFLLGFILYGTLGFLPWVAISFPILGKFFYYNPFGYFLMYFPFVFFWDSHDLNIIILNTSLEVSETILISLFFFISFCFSYFYHSIFQLTYPFFCLSWSTVGSLQCTFNLSVCIVHHWLFVL